MNGWLRFIGDNANRVLTALDLGNLGAEAQILEKLGENAAVTFVRGVAQKVEPVVAEFIASHPALQAEFHTLSDDEAADEVADRTGNSPVAGDSSWTTQSSSDSSTPNSNEAAEPSTSGSGSKSTSE